MKTDVLTKPTGVMGLATKLGISPSELNDGNVVEKRVRVNSLEEFKDLFSSHLNDETKAKHTRDIKARHPEAFKSNAPKDALQRINAHVFGDHSLSEEDKALSKRMFPIEIHTATAQNITINKPVVYGPSASPVVLNYGTVTFTDNGSIAAENTILNLNAEKIIVNTSSGSTPYHIGILGVKGTKGTDGPDGTSYPTQAASGSDSKPSTPGICDKGSGGNGSKGSDGGNGQNGHSGDDGKPSLQANINIANDIVGSLAVFTQSGEGGDGGNGGDGGLGQQGGNGGKGCDSGCEGTNGGDGANGGNGGNAGNGGNGGNGIQGNNVYVTVPSGKTNQIVHFSQVAAPGNAGKGGALGQPGAGGTHGKGGKHHSNGQNGSPGNPGKPGEGGKPGTVSGQPGTIYVS